MTKLIPVVLGLICSTVILAGCASQEKQKTLLNQQNGDCDVKKETIFPQVAAAFLNNSYSALSPCLSDEMQQKLSQTAFEEMISALERFGKIEQMRLAAALQGEIWISEIWIITQVKIDEDKKKNL